MAFILFVVAFINLIPSNLTILTGLNTDQIERLQHHPIIENAPSTDNILMSDLWGIYNFFNFVIWYVIDLVDTLVILTSVSSEFGILALLLAVFSIGEGMVIVGILRGV